MRIPVVDENDNFLYYKEEHERDRRREITRGSALWGFNEDGEWLVAKRSKNKNNFPNLWGASAAGGMEEDETYESNLIRETREEIGFKLEKFTLGPKLRESDNHEFFSQYFFAKIPKDTKFVLQASEVDAITWISLSELKKWFLENPEEFLPTFKNSIRILDDYETQNKKNT